MYVFGNVTLSSVLIRYLHVASQTSEMFYGDIGNAKQSQTTSYLPNMFVVSHFRCFMNYYGVLAYLQHSHTGFVQYWKVLGLWQKSMKSPWISKQWIVPSVSLEKCFSYINSVFTTVWVKNWKLYMYMYVSEHYLTLCLRSPPSECLLPCFQRLYGVALLVQFLRSMLLFSSCHMCFV